MFQHPELALTELRATGWVRFHDEPITKERRRKGRACALREMTNTDRLGEFLESRRLRSFRHRRMLLSMPPMTRAERIAILGYSP